MGYKKECRTPSRVDLDLANQRLSHYHFAQQFVKNKLVLDLGCASGRGSGILAQVAGKVLAMDGLEESSDFTIENRAQSNIEFVVCHNDQIPLRCETLDVVVCFEVIQQVANSEHLMNEVRRCLRPDGVFVISTPNRVSSENHPGLSPRHRGEFDLLEFSAYLRNHFDRFEICFQSLVDSIIIYKPSIQNCLRAEFELLGTNLEHTCSHFVAVCSKATNAFPGYESSIFVPSVTNLLREKDRSIDLLDAQVRGLDQQVSRQQQEYDAQGETCLESSRQLEERTSRAMNLHERIREQEDLITQLQEKYRDLEGELQTKAAWAKFRQGEISVKEDQLVSLRRAFDEKTVLALQLNEELRSTIGKVDMIRQSRLFQVARELRLLPKVWE